jgi:hypothetical protein
MALSPKERYARWKAAVEREEPSQTAVQVARRLGYAYTTVSFVLRGRALYASDALKAALAEYIAPELPVDEVFGPDFPEVVRKPAAPASAASA